MLLVAFIVSASIPPRPFAWHVVCLCRLLPSLFVSSDCYPCLREGRQREVGEGPASASTFSIELAFQRLREGSRRQGMGCLFRLRRRPRTASSAIVHRASLLSLSDPSTEQEQSDRNLEPSLSHRFQQDTSSPSVPAFTPPPSLSPPLHKHPPPTPWIPPPPTSSLNPPLHLTKTPSSSPSGSTSSRSSQERLPAPCATK